MLDGDVRFDTVISSSRVCQPPHRKQCISASWLRTKHCSYFMVNNLFQPSHRKPGHRASSAIDNKEGRNLGGREKSNNAIEVSRPSTTQAFRVWKIIIICLLSACLVLSLVHQVQFCPLAIGWFCPFLTVFSFFLHKGFSSVSFVSLFSSVPCDCVQFWPDDRRYLCLETLYVPYK